jgi:hypothetical protein
MTASARKRRAQNVAARRRYMAANPDARDNARRARTARRIAMEALARKYPADYQQLYVAELRYLGVPAELTRTCPCGNTIRRMQGIGGPWAIRCAPCQAQITAEAMVPGVSMAKIARTYGMTPSTLYRWVRGARGEKRRRPT